MTKQEQVETRMFELTSDLRNTNRKQNFTYLTTTEGFKVITYCALGVIGCEKKMIGFKENPKYKDDYDEEYERKFNYFEPPHGAILNIYGLQDDLKHPVVISYYNKRTNNRGRKLENEVKWKLSEIITSLNDDGHFTFKQIADYLDELRLTNVITTCSKQDKDEAKNFLLENRIKEY